MERVEADVKKCRNETHESVFTGRMLELLGIELATIFISALTFSIAYPWMLCWKQSWYADHTYINGKQMRFDGTGGQLIGSWLKWILLTIITLGIYLLWLPIKVQQWAVKHTYFEGERDKESKFTGSMLGLWGTEILGVLVSACTLGIAWPWMWCWQAGWYREHMVISGKQLHFNGKGGQFLGNWLKWMLLIFITLGIYILWFPVRIEQWAVKHTYIDDSHTTVIPDSCSLDEKDVLNKVCPECKREQSENAEYCRFCGAKLIKGKPNPSKHISCSEIISRFKKRGEDLSTEQIAIGPTPAGGAYAIQRKNDNWIEITEYDYNDNPIHRIHGTCHEKRTEEKVNQKNICPHCGARHAAGEVRCKYCSTPMNETQSTADKQKVIVDSKMTQTSTATPEKKSKKVICPHCGARQPEDSVRCKYCGTSIQ